MRIRGTLDGDGDDGGREQAAEGVTLVRAKRSIPSSRPLAVSGFICAARSLLSSHHLASPGTRTPFPLYLHDTLADTIMLGRSKRPRDTSSAAHDQQPLLTRSSEDLHQPDEDSVIFSVQDDDEDYAEASALDLPNDGTTPKSSHSVRFREEVQVIGPPLRSTAESRETGTSLTHVCCNTWLS